MASDITVEEIKRIRGKYGLSRQTFAALLGIGSASMARYENGQVPTKANVNLIRAAENPKFMRDCFERERAALPPNIAAQAEKVIYALVTFDEKGDVMDVNEMYTLTLEQEILCEQIASIMADVWRKRATAEKAGDTGLIDVFDAIVAQLALVKPALLSDENFSASKISELKGQVVALKSLVDSLGSKAA